MVLQWFTNNAAVSRDVGLAGNDTAAFYPLVAFVLCAAYFSANRRKVVGDYFQGEEEFHKDLDVKVIAQLGLRFFTEVADHMGAFNQTTPSERNEREEQFINFIKVANQQFNQKKTGMHMSTELVSGAARSEANETPAQDPGVHNTDCTDQFPQTSWWKARYSFDSIFEHEENEATNGGGIKVGTRWLPISFYLEGTEAAGARITLYGAVKSLRVECDRDVTSAVPVDSISWKMNMELVDTNWRQNGGTPGKNRVFKFVCSQQSDKCVFSTLIGSDGKAFNVFVSRFKLRLEPRPVTSTTDVLSGFMEGESDSSGLAHLTIHPGRDLVLSYLVRSLPFLDSTIVWSKQEKERVLLVGGATSKTPLPLEVHLTSPEGIDEDGNKFVAYPVSRIMLRYTSKPPSPGQLKPDSASIMSVQMLLKDGRTLAQDANTKSDWVIDDKVLHKAATVDLLVLNKTPGTVGGIGGKTRKPGLNNGARKSEVNGVVHFSDFGGLRQGFSPISVGMPRQERIRSFPRSADRETAAQASQPWNDVRVRPRSKKPELKEVLGEERARVIIMGGAVALLAGWGFGNDRSIAAIGKLTSGGGFLVALVAFAIAVAEYTDRLPDHLRPYEPILYVSVGVTVLSLMATTMYASRFVPETSPAMYVSIALAVMAAAVVLSFETSSPVPLSPMTGALKVSLLFIMATSVLIASSEVYKMARKPAAVGMQTPLPTNIGSFPNLAAVLTLAALGLVGAGLGAVVFANAPDRCDKHFGDINRSNAGAALNAGQEDDRQKAAYKYFTQEADAALARSQVCAAEQHMPYHETRMFADPRLRDFTPVVIIAVTLFLSLGVPSVGQAITDVSPSRLGEEERMTSRSSSPAPLPLDRVEDGRTPRGMWVFKSMLGVLLVAGVIRLLLPHAERPVAYCSHLREMEASNRLEVAKHPLTMDGSARMTMIKEGEHRFDCMPEETIATLAVVGIIVIVLLLSFLAPARKRFTPTHTGGLGVIVNLLFFVAVSSTMAWCYAEENRTKVLQL